MKKFLFFIFLFQTSLFAQDLEKAILNYQCKTQILDFFGDIGTISKYMESYLFPEKYYDVYSDILNVPISLLAETIELCDKPDLDKEDFKKQVLELQLFK